MKNGEAPQQPGELLAERCSTPGLAHKTPLPRPAYLAYPSATLQGWVVKAPHEGRESGAS